MSSVSSRALGLTTVVDGQARLVGAKCPDCGTHAFPAQAACSRCGAMMNEVALPAEGTVWSWTVQRIMPKPPYNGPQPFQPFAVGYVDLGPLKVESPLAGHAVDTWCIGEPVALVVSESGELGSHLLFWFESKEQSK